MVGGEAVSQTTTSNLDRKTVCYQVVVDPFIEVVFVVVHPDLSHAHRVLVAYVGPPLDGVGLPEDVPHV